VLLRDEHPGNLPLSYLIGAAVAGRAPGGAVGVRAAAAVAAARDVPKSRHSARLASIQPLGQAHAKHTIPIHGAAARHVAEGPTQYAAHPQQLRPMACCACYVLQH
jgi:hypothetical protein